MSNRGKTEHSCELSEMPIGRGNINCHWRRQRETEKERGREREDRNVHYKITTRYTSVMKLNENIRALLFAFRRLRDYLDRARISIPLFGKCCRVNITDNRHKLITRTRITARAYFIEFPVARCVCEVRSEIATFREGEKLYSRANSIPNIRKFSKRLL